MGPSISTGMALCAIFFIEHNTDAIIYCFRAVTRTRRSEQAEPFRSLYFIKGLLSAVRPRLQILIPLYISYSTTEDRRVAAERKFHQYCLGKS